MVKDSNLLFGALCLQVGLIDESQFLAACRMWLTRRESTLADVLVESGQISQADAAAVERLAESRVQTGPDFEVRRTLAALRDPPDDPCETSFPDPTAATEEEAGVRISRERYTLTRLHAQGGLGRVWLAHDESLGREVALKELRPERADRPSVGSRFLQEARVTGQLEHPNIVPVYELSRGGPASPPFYAMRFVKGRTLAEAIRDYHRDRRAGGAGLLEFRALLNALVSVGNAIAFAHARGVIHRDLKPQNVVVGDYGEVVVLDWGLAKRLGDPEPRGPEPSRWEPAASELGPSGISTVEGQALGTPAYMPPEQAAGLACGVDRRSDVYGLGAILYEVLTGRPPFSDADTATLLRKVREQPPQRPRVVRPSTDPALEAVCLKALAKDPTDRYDDAPEFSAELERWLAGEPVLAYAEPLPARVRRWIATHRTAVSTSAAATLVALVALVIATALLAYGRDRERQAREQAEAHRLLAVRQEAKARENFAMARAVVERSLTLISESELLNKPGLQPLREQLLREGMRYYAKFAAEHADDPSLQADLAASHLRLGRITEEIGSKSEALAHYRRARRVLDDLAEGRPDDPRWLSALADCQNRLGNLEEALGRTDDALASLTAARGLASQLTGRFPGDPRHRNRLAGIENNLGNVQRAAGMTDQALASYRRARGEFGLLALATADADEAVTGYRSSVAGTDQNIGVLLRETGRLDEALASLERARDLRVELAAGKPSDRLRQDLAQGLNQLGLTLRELGRSSDALQAHSQALEIQEELASANPAVTDYQSDLAANLVNLGSLAGSLGRHDQALANHGKAREVLQALAEANPHVRVFRARLATIDHLLGIVLQEIGRTEEARLAYLQAIQTLERLTRDNPSDGPLQTETALVWNNLGGLVRAGGRPDEALPLHRKARDVFERLASEGSGPGRVAHRAALAQTYNHLGLALRDLGRTSDALGLHRKALGVLEELGTSSPDSATLRRDQGITLLNLAVIHRQAGDPDRAFPQAKRARAIFEELFQAAPQADQGRRDLVSSLDLLGDLHGDVGRSSEAVELFARARDLQEASLGGPNQSPDDRSLLAAVLGHMGQILERSGDSTGALEAIGRAVEHQWTAHDAASDSTTSRRLLSELLGQLGRLQRRMHRHAEADATARRRLALASSEPPDPESMIQAAADLALGLPTPGETVSRPALTAPSPKPDSGAELRVAEAWGALRRALEIGFDDVESLRRLPELAGLFAVAEVAAWFDRLQADRNARPETPPVDQECQAPTVWKKARGTENSGDAIGKNLT